MSRYRDTETGQFASKESWEDDHGPGGRYVRESSERAEPQEPSTDFEDFPDDYMLEPDFDIDLGEDEY
jgi:hypothetical protein